jgi:hypothetical protein
MLFRAQSIRRTVVIRLRELILRHSFSRNYVDFSGGPALHLLSSNAFFNFLQ